MNHINRILIHYGGIQVKHTRRPSHYLLTFAAICSGRNRIFSKIDFLAHQPNIADDVTYGLLTRMKARIPCGTWQYQLWSFQGRDTKLEIFMAKIPTYSKKMLKF